MEMNSLWKAKKRRIRPMKRKAAAAAALIVAVLSAAGCSDNNVGNSSSVSGGSSVSSAAVTDSVINPDQMNEAFKDVPDLAGDGAQVSLSNTTAKPGGIAEVTMSVKNADLQWNMCGIHIIYPEVLKPEMSNPAEREVKFKKGDALEAASGAVCMEWQDELPSVLAENKKGCIFFTSMFSGNKGMDGDIATFYFKVPENAESGAVYDLGYFYMKTDLFTNEENIPSFQKYAFTHMQGGKITVE